MEPVAPRARSRSGSGSPAQDRSWVSSGIRSATVVAVVGSGTCPFGWSLITDTIVTSAVNRLRR